MDKATLGQQRRQPRHVQETVTHTEDPRSPKATFHGKLPTGKQQEQHQLNYYNLNQVHDAHQHL